MSDAPDPSFVDVNFTSDPRFVFGDLGRHPTRNCATAPAPTPLIPEGRWRELAELIDASDGGLDSLVTRVFNQGQEGSCVANATAQQNQILQAAQFGAGRVVQLSPISLYKRIGRSPSSGAMVDDGYTEQAERGILPLDTPANRKRFGAAVMPATGFFAKYPDNWEATAKRFRGDEASVITSTAALFSTLFAGFPVVVGRDGHSVCYLRPVFRRGRWLIKYVNSWDVNWGEAFGPFPGGFGYDSVNQFEQSARWAFAVRSIVSAAV